MLNGIFLMHAPINLFSALMRCRANAAVVFHYRVNTEANRTSILPCTRQVSLELQHNLISTYLNCGDAKGITLLCRTFLWRRIILCRRRTSKTYQLALRQLCTSHFHEVSKVPKPCVKKHTKMLSAPCFKCYP